jgi:hypothetical protein
MVSIQVKKSSDITPDSIDSDETIRNYLGVKIGKIENNGIVYDE